MASDKKIINNYTKIAKQIINLEDEYSKLSDEQLSAKTEEFKERVEKGESLDSILIPAYATVREVAFRVLKLKAYLVQLVGAIILHYGDVAEMKTGEGKTLTGIFPAYLNALTGKPVHIVTVNEYLSQRDSLINGKVFNFLNISVGLNSRNLNKDEKRQAYLKDITYTTNSELGFDYLKDNLVTSANQKVQRGLNYVIIDEADSVLIDEARTPLIISGGSQNRVQFYKAADAFAKSLNKDVDLLFDLETKQVALQDSGIEKAEKYFSLKNLFDINNAEIYHLILNALKANYMFKEGVEYMVNAQREIELIDQFTGRVLEGRSYSDGLQQAIQAKEGVEVEEETVTLATITYQNFYRLYAKISGMTGTAKTEEEEFIKIYNTRIIVCPTNKPLIRRDYPDYTFGSKNAALKKMVADIREINEIGRPILIGTTSVESSEQVARYLEKENLKFEMINAKNHFREADIVEKAGQLKSITLATNMAGRGTDIKLTEETRKLGGLFVFGVERNEARRIDNQLRGRSGRQGDPGDSRFYVSMDDELMIRFSSPRMKSMFMKLGEDHIQSRLFTKAITNAQKKLEGLNFDQRKNILDYDNILSQQRESIYSQRDVILFSPTLENVISKFQYTFAFEKVSEASEVTRGEKTVNLQKLFNLLKGTFISEADWNLKDFIGLEINEIANKLQTLMMKHYLSKNRNIPEDVRQDIERKIILRKLDHHWTNHINLSQKLRSGIYLQQYAQNNPLHQYIEESAKLFNNMKINITNDSIIELYQITNTQEAEPSMEERTINITENDIKLILEEVGISPEEFSRKNVDDKFKQLIENEKDEVLKDQWKMKFTIVSGFMDKLDEMYNEKVQNVNLTNEDLDRIVEKFDFKNIQGDKEKIKAKITELCEGKTEEEKEKIYFEAIILRDIDRILKNKIKDMSKLDEVDKQEFKTKLG
ncbi:preprotein translocase subunit SecA [Spiroplasma endosymbiont of Crioceris asparagi]|uniref:preprotein translocase subunit SecA n=1 Tax=Spiroplasma endosymbiont of Crioceris asparagi TaxID=3066286 RepID=UPI0030CCEE32